MFTTTTIGPVHFHGWTLPAGSTVTVTDVHVEMYSPVEQYTTASVTTDVVDHDIAVPTGVLAATYTELNTVPWHTDYLY